MTDPICHRLTCAQTSGYAIKIESLIAQRDRLLSALRNLVNEPQDITSKAYQYALGVLGEFEG